MRLVVVAFALLGLASSLAPGCDGESSSRPGAQLCADVCQKGNANGCGSDFDDTDCASVCESGGQRLETLGCGEEWRVFLECLDTALDATCTPKDQCGNEEDAAFETCPKAKCSADPSLPGCADIGG